MVRQCSIKKIGGNEIMLIKTNKVYKVYLICVNTEIKCIDKSKKIKIGCKKCVSIWNI